MTRHTASPPTSDSTADLRTASAPDGSNATSASEVGGNVTGGANEAAQIDEIMISRLVEAFYARAREDAILGPVFNRHVDDWPTHLARITQFWASVLLSTGSYTGSPMQRHAPLPIDASHFRQWLALFEETAIAECPPPAAQRFIEAAQRMARSLQLARAPLPPLRPRSVAVSAPTQPGVSPSSSAAARIAALRALLPESGNDA